MAEIIQQCQFLGRPHPALLKDEFFNECKKAGITSLQSYLTWAEIEKEKDKFDFSSYDVLVEKIKQHGMKWVPFLILGPEYATPKWFQDSKESVFYRCLEHDKDSKIQSLWNPNLPKYVERFIGAAAHHYLDHDIFESVTVGISGNWGEAIYPADGGFNKNFHTHPGWWAGDECARKAYNKEMPFLKRDRKREIKSWLIGFASQMPLPLKGLAKSFLKTSKRKFIFSQEGASAIEDQNFIKWYLDSMTDWVGFWLETARKYFPQTSIYLVTGGIGNPPSGADFTAQVKMAKKYGVGIRITNQTNDYGQSFILTRLISSACKFYGVPFVTEEAGVLQTPEGVVMRIFDAVSSGAQGIYCKNFFSTGNDDPCLRKEIPAGTITDGALKLKENLRWFNLGKPIVNKAVFFEEASVDFYEKCIRLRNLSDFDLVDKRMIDDGVLKNYKEFLKIEDIVFNDPEIEGFYSARFENKTLYYNSNNYKVKKGQVEIGPHSIISQNI